MANNPYVNKVVFGSATLVDLTGTTATADKIMQGYGAFGADGAWMDGTATGGDQHGTIWQDGQGYVHLDDESGIALQSKSVTPSESQQIVEAGEGYYALDKVTVGAISSSYVGSGITRRSSSDLSASGATVTAPAGYYETSASKSVASGTAGTPTATKSAVSNHAVTVTPSVTNTTGYITGSTKTGTAVSVSASELVSGTYNVTSSGTKDVTNYASISVPSGTEGTPTATKGSVSNHSVSVTPSVTNAAGYIGGSTKTGTAVTVSASELVSGSQTVTQNGTVDVTNLASLVVNVDASTDFVVTFTKNQSGDWIPDCTFTEFSNAYYAGKTIGARTSGGVQPTVSVYDDGVWVVAVSDWFEEGEGSLWYQAIKTKNYQWSPSGMYFDYETVTYLTDGADAVPSNVANGKIFFNSQGVQIGTASGGIVTGSFTVASTISTTTDVTITTTTAIGFTPNKFIFTKNNQATTTNAINMTEWIVNGGRSQRIRATLNSSNTLTVGSNTSNWTSMSAGYLSFNSSTGEIYIRVTSSYILEADTYTWLAVE